MTYDDSLTPAEIDVLLAGTTQQEESYIECPKSVDIKFWTLTDEDEDDECHPCRQRSLINELTREVTALKEYIGTLESRIDRLENRRLIDFDS